MGILPDPTAPSAERSRRLKTLSRETWAEEKLMATENGRVRAESGKEQRTQCLSSSHPSLPQAYIDHPVLEYGEFNTRLQFFFDFSSIER